MKPIQKRAHSGKVPQTPFKSAPPPSAAAGAALFNETVDWAIERLACPNTVIIDTETTGIGDKDEIVQIGIIDMRGTVLLDTLVKPNKRKMPPEAEAIHKISIDMLKDAPKIAALYHDLQRHLSGKIVIAYNAEYDARMLKQSLDKAGLPSPVFHSQWHCAMLRYATFMQEWDEYHGHYRWHKLLSAEHNAVGDCRSALKLIEEVAKTEKRSHQAMKPLTAGQGPAAHSIGQFVIKSWKILAALTAVSMIVSAVGGQAGGAIRAAWIAAMTLFFAGGLLATGHRLKALYLCVVSLFVYSFCHSVMPQVERDQEARTEADYKKQEAQKNQAQAEPVKEKVSAETANHQHKHTRSKTGAELPP